jgi:hypothetical protein
VEIPHETFTQAQQLSAFLLLDFYRLKLHSDLFNGETARGFELLEIPWDSDEDE